MTNVGCEVEKVFLVENMLGTFYLDQGQQGFIKGVSGSSAIFSSIEKQLDSREGW